MSNSKRIKNLIFILFFLFAIFGVFIIYLSWIVLRNPKLPNPGGENYQIRGIPSGTFPDALFYDFESPQPKEVILYNEGRSGKASISAKGYRSHSSVINIPLGNWDAEKAKQISLSAWVKTDSSSFPTDAALAFAITDPYNNVLFCRQITIKSKHIKANKWFQISTSFQTSGYTFHSDDRIRIYLWNNADNNILLDDLLIIFGNQTHQPNYSEPFFYNRQEVSTLINTPPYPSLWLSPAQIGNNNSSSLIITNKPNFGSFSHAEVLMAANFIHPKGTAQQIISLSPGILEIYWFLKKEQLFTRLAMQQSGLNAGMLQNAEFLCGDFCGDNYDEIIIRSNASDSLIILEALTNNNSTYTLHLNYYKIPELLNYLKIILLDVNGDHKKELLAIDKSGKWIIMRFLSDKWLVMATSETIVNEWNQNQYIYSLTVVPQSGNENKDQLLMIFNLKDKKNYRYKLLYYNESKNTFVSAFNKNSGFGISIGTDSLKPTDEFYFVNMYSGNSPELLRSRSEWRFDLKLLAFNDSAYSIIGNIDFTGNATGENPKFQEEVILLPACFIEKDKWGLLVISRPRNQSNYNSVFPSKIQYYLPQNINKSE